MLFDVLDAALLVAQSFCGIVATQLLNEVYCISGNIARKVNCIDPFEDNVVGAHRVNSRKGRRASEQFVHEHTQRPVVGRVVVSSIQDYLRCHVFGSEREKI